MGSIMKNITITLDEQTAAWVRMAAAKRKMSVSRLIGDLLHDRMRETRDYNEAMRRFFSHKPFNFEWVGGRPTREEIHDRARAREDLVREDLASGALVRVLEDWCPPFPGFYLYYPSRAQMPLKLRVLIDFLASRCS